MTDPNTRTICPHCDTQFRIPTRALGQEVPCKKCGNRFVLSEGKAIFEIVEEDRQMSGEGGSRAGVCVHCGADMPIEANLCIECGFDRLTGKVLSTETEAAPRRTKSPRKARTATPSKGTATTAGETQPPSPKQGETSPKGKKQVFVLIAIAAVLLLGGGGYYSFFR